MTGKRGLTRSLITLAVLLSLTSTMPGCAPVADRSDQPPNIIIIFADDLGYSDLSSYGASGWSTPNLDALASGGVRFTDFYVPNPACSPSRAGLLTGRYPLKAGIREVLNPRSLRGLPESETTIAEVLRESGYTTAAVGKWHLGSHPDFLPTNHGFDSWFGLPYSNDMSRLSINNPRPHAANWPPLPLMRDTTIVEREPDQRFLTERYTQESIRFIRENHEEPFFLYLAHSMPHVPLWVSESFEGVSQAGLYGDVVTELDASVGRIMDELRAQRLDGNTIVVFTSDNGPWLLMGEHSGTRGDFREGKATTFEGGVRMPGIMYAPGRIPAGSLQQGYAISLDIMPTVLKMAGLTPPENLDGRDISAELITGTTISGDRPLFFYRSGQLQAVRYQKWKLHVPHRYASMTSESGAVPGTGGHPGTYGRGEIGLALFDLENDPAELVDVAEDYPDVMREILTHVEDARSRIGDELTGRVGADATPPQLIAATWPTLLGK